MGGSAKLMGKMIIKYITLNYNISSLMPHIIIILAMAFILFILFYYVIKNKNEWINEIIILDI